MIKISTYMEPLLSHRNTNSKPCVAGCDARLSAADFEGEPTAEAAQSDISEDDSTLSLCGVSARQAANDLSTGL